MKQATVKINETVTPSLLFDWDMAIVGGADIGLTRISFVVDLALTGMALWAPYN